MKTFSHISQYPLKSYKILAHSHLRYFGMHLGPPPSIDKLVAFSCASPPNRAPIELQFDWRAYQVSWS